VETSAIGTKFKQKSHQFTNVFVVSQPKIHYSFFVDTTEKVSNLMLSFQNSAGFSLP